MASKGGADTPPAWYVNLKADPEVEVQVKGDRFKAHGARRDAGREARDVEDDDRRVAGLRRVPGRTDREIPVIVLEREESRGARALREGAISARASSPSFSKRSA